jgi:hypothetical protein
MLIIDSFPHGPVDSSYYALYLPEDDLPHGYLVPDIVARIPWTSDFSIRHEPPRSVTVVNGSPSKDPATAVNDAFSSLLAATEDMRKLSKPLKKH